jgi:hypothetical protein
VIDYLVGEPLYFAMERKMMLGFKQRAESAPTQRSPAASAAKGRPLLYQQSAAALIHEPQRRSQFPPPNDAQNAQLCTASALIQDPATSAQNESLFVSRGSVGAFRGV